MDIPYCFEGLAKPTCTKCNRSHEITFSGDEGTTPEAAIVESLTLDGWDAKRLICPECYDPNDDPIDEDEDSSDNEFDDDFDDIGDLETQDAEGVDE